MLYGCETGSLTLREERRLREFENRILRRIFEPKRDENGEWRRLHNEKNIHLDKIILLYYVYLLIYLVDLGPTRGLNSIAVCH